MASKKKLTISKSGTYKGSNDTKIIDVIAVKAAKKVYVNAQKGNDQVTIAAGSNKYDYRHIIHGDAGNDTIKVNKGSYHTIYGDAGKDKIYVNTTGKGVYVYGGGGSDQIFVNKGKNHYIFGGKSADKITINKGAGNGINVDGEAGGDTIYIKGGGGHTISGGADKDNIYFSYGKVGVIDGGTHNDYIEVKGSNVQNGKAISVETSYSGQTSFNSGISQIWGGAGNDKIVVAAKNNYYIRGDAGGDTITVTGGSGHYIDGDNRAKYDEGADKITLTNVSNSNINAGYGNDTVTLNSGNNNTIMAGYGDDIINVKSGTDNTIRGNMGSNTIHLYGGSGIISSNTTGNGTKYSSIYIEKPTGIGVYSISGDSARKDALYIKNFAKENITKANLSKSGMYLTIDFAPASANSGEVTISYWYENNCPFNGTINFVNDKNQITGSLTYKEIETLLK